MKERCTAMRRLAAALGVVAVTLGVGMARTGPTPPALAQQPGAGGDPPALAQPDAQAPTDSLALFLITFGPGQAIWERFGHNALWIHDPSDGSDIAYDYGRFDFSDDDFLPRFLRGHMLYSMGESHAQSLMRAYRRSGRDVWVQRLAVPAADVRRLQAFLRWNVRPENRHYRYDYFRDNCSTRIRDALDRALGGALARRLTAEPTTTSYRREALELTAPAPLLSAGMDVGMGPLADRRLTRWQQAFLPARLRDQVRDMSVAAPGDSAAATGDGRPLVAEEWYLPAEDAPAAGGGEGGLRPAHLPLGLLLGGLMYGLGRVATRRVGRSARIARVALGALGALWGALAGLLGTVLLALWMLTDHVFAHANENLLQLNPLALAFVVLVPLALGRGRSEGGRVASWALGVAAALAGLSIVGLLAQALPSLDQSNGGVIAMALPIHVGLALALRRLRSAGRTPAQPQSSAATRASSTSGNVASRSTS